MDRKHGNIRKEKCLHMLSDMPQKGKSGLESSQNFNLLTSNAFFLEKLANEFKDQKNTGDTVVTTLDANLQNAKDIMHWGDNKGAVVVMEPSTGKILAMVSKPSFDPNNVSENWDALNNDENSSLLNRATLGQYTPGSTFKLVTTLAFSGRIRIIIIIRLNVMENFHRMGRRSTVITALPMGKRI